MENEYEQFQKGCKQTVETGLWSQSIDTTVDSDVSDSTIDHKAFLIQHE